MSNHYGGWTPPQEPAPEQTSAPAPPTPEAPTAETVEQPSLEARLRQQLDEVKEEYTRWLANVPQRLAAFSAEEARQDGVFRGALQACQQALDLLAPTTADPPSQQRDTR